MSGRLATRAGLLYNVNMKFHIQNCGSIVLVRPLGATSAQWLRETAPEDASFFGTALAVEPRYIENVINAIIEAGGEL